MLWGARISRIKKFFLIVLFSGGFFVIMAAILRAYFILTDSVTGGAQAAGWGVREIFVAFFIGNVPMIYGGLRLWLHSFKESKVYARIRARTRDWPGANRFSALFGSRTPWSSGRHGGNASSGNRTLAGDEVGGPNIAMAKTTDPASRPSLLPWGHSRTASRIDTNIKRSDTERGVTDPTGFGIQVTRGIHVDVESVKRRESDGLQSFETVAGKEPSRTGSEAQLGPLMTESPSKPASARGQVSELPSGPHQEKEKKTILQIPKDVRSREQRTSDGPNDTKWIADDSP